MTQGSYLAFNLLNSWCSERDSTGSTAKRLWVHTLK